MLDIEKIRRWTKNYIQIKECTTLYLYLRMDPSTAEFGTQRLFEVMEAVDDDIVQSDARSVARLDSNRDDLFAEQ